MRLEEWNNVALRIKSAVRFRMVSIIVLVRMQHSCLTATGKIGWYKCISWMVATKPKTVIVHVYSCAMSSSTFQSSNELSDISAVRTKKDKQLTWKVPSDD
jgi:hypothetical protein